MKTYRLKFCPRLNQRGQSAIEFIIVVVVVFFFLLFYLSFSITLVASEYVDYVTFMAARTYKSDQTTEAFQRQAAQQVFSDYLTPLNSIIHSPTLSFLPGNGANQTQGVTSQYQVDLFYLPPIFVTNTPTPSRLTLSSESLLGRDPSQSECLDFFANFAKRTRLNIGGTFLVNVMEDNGC